MHIYQGPLADAVREGHVEKARVALSTYLSKNPSNSGNEVMDAVNYAEMTLTNLWEEHDGENLIGDRASWTTDYLGLLKSDLRSNFSRERFEFIIEVGKVVRPQRGAATTETRLQPSVAPVSSHLHSQIPTEPIGGKSNKIWLIAAGIGGLAILALLIAKGAK
ncbi:hypothetical protein [Paenibacillus sp. FSL K6-2862]|uniref:hypothetical protein n=1 Tax=Paenibacillus sp. FSL K6-2862 TaxID=2921484 RepID=UPI0030FCB25D